MWSWPRKAPDQTRILLRIEAGNVDEEPPQDGSLVTRGQLDSHHPEPEHAAFAFGAVALFLPLIRDDLDLSFSQAGTLAAVSTFVYA